MTDNHPITPPPELVQRWRNAAPPLGLNRESWIATAAARWGSDQELEACCAWTAIVGGAEALRNHRRPKPPSLAEQALTLLDDASTRLDAAHENTIRRALERLQELEGGK